MRASRRQGGRADCAPVSLGSQCTAARRLAGFKGVGFDYKSNIIWHKLRKDGGSDGRGVGFYFRNVTEILLFGVRGKNARTLELGRTQVNTSARASASTAASPMSSIRSLRDAALPVP